MPTPARVLLWSAIGLLAYCLPGCNMAPYHALRHSQIRSAQLHQEGQMLAAERDQAALLAQSLESEKEQLARRAAALEQSLNVANSRLDNLNAERSQLQQRMVSLLNQAQNQPSPLSSDTTRRFEELARKYPQFEFDPQTGVSKFANDLLFDSGSAQIKPAGARLLREFAGIMNQGDATRLNVLIVGHTDDQPIAKPGTRNQHPTNWHLSTNRANSVVLELEKSGIKPPRMGAAGYSMFQPVAPNSSDAARAKNRRVEIYVLAPDAAVAGWDPATSRN